MRFKEYMKNESEERKDIKSTLEKLPNSHKNLVQGFSWKLQGGNTLNGDNQHVGYMDSQRKEIAVAAPWNYSREFCALHEIAHVVYERLPNQIKHQWTLLVQQTKNEMLAKNNSDNQECIKQNAEEIFCMCYATFYSKHKIATYNHPEWMKFIQNLPQ